MRYFVAMALVLMGTVAAGQTTSTTTSAPATKEAATRPHFTLGKETTRITGPLRSDGRPDYVGAIDAELAKGVTAENNACVALLEVFGTGEQVLSPLVRAETLKRMGMPERNDGAKFRTFEEFLKEAGLSEAERNAQEEQSSQARAKLWTEKEHPEVAKWLVRNADALARVAKGVEREHYYWPMVALGERAPMISVPLPALGREREVANALAARAMLRLSSGEVRGCQADLLAVHRLGRLVTQGAKLSDKLVGMGIETLAGKGDVILAGNLGAADAKEYLTQLGKLPAIRPVWEAVDVDARYLMLDSTMGLAYSGLGAIDEITGGEPTTGLPATKVLKDVDWDQVLKRMNVFYDRQVGVMKLPTFAQRKASSEAFEKDMLKEKKAAAKSGMMDVDAFSVKLEGLAPAEQTQRIGDFLFGVFFPSLGRATEIADRAKQETDLGTLAVALAAYHGDKRSYPEKLEELSPAYLKEVPKDVFADAALNYFRKDAGYVLYSVGPNMVDDQGIAGKTWREGDMVVRVRK